MRKRLELADASQLTDHLWIGGELDPSDSGLANRQLDELTAGGIDAIIDCRLKSRDVDWVTATKRQIDYLHIGVEDAGWRMPADWFDDGVEYGLDQIEQGHIVLTHCQAGVDLGPSMGFAILIAQGRDAIEALDQIRRARPTARIGYAEDAVQWWFDKIGASTQDQRLQVDRIRQWRAANGLPRRSDSNL